MLIMSHTQTKIMIIFSQKNSALEKQALKHSLKTNNFAPLNITTTSDRSNKMKCLCWRTQAIIMKVLNLWWKSII